MNKEAFPIGVIAEVLARLGGQTYGNMPKKKGDKPEDIGYPQAAASGIFGPIGTAVHGGIVDRRNQTGDWAGTKPSAVNRLAIGRILGGLGGAAAGYMVGDATQDYGGSGLGGLLAGLAGGRVAGTMLGARSYNKAYKKQDEEAKPKDKKEKKASYEEAVLRGFYKRAAEKKNKDKPDPNDVSTIGAGLSGGMFGPIGAAIHGSFANQRNQTGAFHGGGPGASARMAGGTMAGRLTGLVAGNAIGSADGGDGSFEAMLGLLAGGAVGSGLGAHSYNNAMHKYKKEKGRGHN